MDILIFGSLVGVAGYVRVVMLVSGLECEFVCLFAVCGKEGRKLQTNDVFGFVLR